MVSERRSTKRVACELQSSFRDFDSVTSWSSSFASIKDISRGGMRLRMHTPIHLNDRLGIAFNLPNNHKTIEVRATPVWISEIPNTGIYNVGVRFLEIFSEDKIAIESFC